MSDGVVLVSAKRSPFGKYLGSLADLDPVDLAAQVARAALEVGGRDLAPEVEQVFVGNCIQASFATGSVNGRQIALRLGIPGFATTFDTACCSPLTALRSATTAMRLGELECGLVIGVESMSRTPHVARGLRGGVRVGPAELQDPIYPIEYGGFNPVSRDAADGAERFGVSKAMMDAWALGSHRKWAAAAAAGRFAAEIAPVRVPTRGGVTSFDRDEFPRPDARMSTIEQLPPVFGARTITAGNAPGLNDGAAAAVVMTAARAAELGLEPLAEVAAASGVTEDPTGIAWVPATAIRAALERAGIGLDRVDLIEINEAFAAMPLVSTRALADGDESRWLALLERTNVNGGAVAIGHPVGASGLRILATLAWELRRRGGGIGVAAICGGLSQGEAVVLRAGGGDHA